MDVASCQYKCHDYAVHIVQIAVRPEHEFVSFVQHEFQTFT